MFETCTTSINRLKNGPDDFPSIINRGWPYFDLFFDDR